jgi:gliding motility-associated-like protein
MVFAQLEFVQNKGQWNSSINFKTDFETGTFYLHKNGFTINLIDSADVRKTARLSHIKNAEKAAEAKDFIIHSFAYNVSFVGANTNPTLIPDKALPTYNNYFIGNDKNKWASDCKIYNAVTYKDIYPNIDIRYYSTQNNLKYDFIVHPGGNPANIALQYSGAKFLKLQNENLIVGTTVGDVKELAPYAYQVDVNTSKDIVTKFVVKNNIVTFEVGKYNKNATLIIDPQLIFCSFVKSTTDNWGYTATPGKDGSFFSGGIDFGSGFPASVGAYQFAFLGGEYDISIFKFSANGTQRLYATYIGGNGLEQPHSMIADTFGNLFIAGRSNSTNYPLLTSIPNTGAGYDIVITKLNATGTALLGSVKIGGSGDDGVNIGDKELAPFGTLSIRQNYGDDARSEIILDANDNVILASCSQSNNFPLLNAVQPTFGGQQDGVILKLNPTLNNLIFSTYFGGSGDDACFVAEINKLNGNLFIGGATSSTNLPGNTAGTVGITSFGGIDGYITVLNPSGSAIIKTCYIGTTGVDAVYGLKFDRNGFPYIMGSATGTMPSTTIYTVPGAKHYIAKLQQDLSAFVYRTNFGKNDPLPSISPIAFLVDKCENVYVSGWGGQVNTITGYANSGTDGLPEVDPLPGLPAADGSDFYFFVLKKDGVAQLFGSHFGQNGAAGDHVDGGTSRFDDNGIIYQAICANCLGFGAASFPTFPNGPIFPWSNVNPSPNCNLAAAKINLDFSRIDTDIKSSIAGVQGDTLGCYPIVVSFRDSIQRGITYFWNFDSQNFPNNVDQITTVPNTNHLFTTGGVFKVRLIAENLNTCNLRDTSYINIYITNRVVIPNISVRKIGVCADNKFEFTNSTTASDATAFTNTSFVWNYGDGSPKDTVNKTPVRIHSFPGTGTYYVTMSSIDRRFCNTPTIDTLKIIIDPNVEAKPLQTTVNCGSYTASFQNQSIFGTAWRWEFYNATTNILLGTSSLFEPSFTFPGQGRYKYRLIAINPNACNLRDTSAFFFVVVANKPFANFTFTPNPPQTNTPYQFVNLSTNATNYLWNFGDGITSILLAPKHEYLRNQPYDIKLIAYNNYTGLICTDTFVLRTIPIIDALLDVPNVFTPGKFGQNGIVYVRGFGIEKMIWKIYNRWGELIFTSTNKLDGWNGYYKGKLQPTDVYTYTLDATFIDGNVVKRTGDITLLR